jgi:hypothetical protein
MKLLMQFPSLSQLDLVKIAINPQSLVTFNPSLSKKSQEIILTGIILWMELCVLEDKLTRMIIFMINIILLVMNLLKRILRREILTIRIWNTSEHVSWLVFEVIGRLQIRTLR